MSKVIIIIGIISLVLLMVWTSKQGIENYVGMPPRSVKVEKIISNEAGECQDSSMLPEIVDRWANVNPEGILKNGYPESCNGDCPGGCTEACQFAGTNKPIVYDRQVFAVQKSRRRAWTDKIRGDLPIKPERHFWFNSGGNPATDLEPGGLNVLGGFDNNAARQTQDLIYSYSGKTKTTLGGMHMGGINTKLYDINSNPHTGDIEVIAFP